MTNKPKYCLKCKSSDIIVTLGYSSPITIFSFCNKCGYSSQTQGTDGIKILSDEEARKRRPQFYKDK